MADNIPTLFRTEALVKLSETVEAVKSIAEKALELAQNSGGTDAYDAADDVEEADDEVVENLLNYDEYDFSSLQAETTYFTMNSCKARKYKDGTMRFFLTITTKSFPALGVAAGNTEETIISNTYIKSSKSDSVLLKVMSGFNWVYIGESGLICNLNAFYQCTINEQYTVACEISADDVSTLTIGNDVPKETVEVTMPDGVKAYDYTYDLTTEAAAVQSQLETNVTFSSLKMVIRNYDRYYAHFSYAGTFGADRNATTYSTALTTDYITASAELYPSPSSSTGDTNFLPYIYPTKGLGFINEDAVSNGDTFSGETTIICPLSATMTINTSNLKLLETNGGKIKTSTAASVQSSSVRYKLIDISEATNGEWIGSINFVQDQLGVFVILSVGTPSAERTSTESLENAVKAITLPISLNTTLEVYKLIKVNIAYEIGRTMDGLSLELYNDSNNGLRLRLNGGTSYLGGFGFCIHGLIPGAYLHTEDTRINYGQDEEQG